jgi:zinc transporter 11
MVEPISALLGAAAVILMEPVLPYALSFAGKLIELILDTNGSKSVRILINILVESIEINTNIYFSNCPFSAGAMMYVVFDDIVPEAQRNGNGKLASFGSMIGFVVMMSLDVGLG